MIYFFSLFERFVYLSVMHNYKMPTLQILLATLILLTNCNNKTTTTKMANTIDISKRDKLVKKYNLMKFPGLTQPVFLTVEEFFDGNNDEASIAPNLDKKPSIEEYYKILKMLSQDPKTVDAFAEIKDVMIYDNGKLNDNEWFYTDIIYFVGNLTKEEVKEATKNLLPDEVEYDTENRFKRLNEKHRDKKVVYVWWD